MRSRCCPRKAITIDERRVTDIRITERDEDERQAFLTVTFGNTLVVRGIAVIVGGGPLFVTVPCRSGPDGRREDV